MDVCDRVKLDFTKCHPDMREYFEKQYKDTVGFVYRLGCEEGIVNVLWPDGCDLSRPWHEDLLVKVSNELDSLGIK